jgi:hypothetical protein
MPKFTEIISKYILIVRNTLLLLCLLLVSVNVNGGGKGTSVLSSYSLGADVHYGFVIAHHPEMWALTDGYFPSYEFSLFKQTNGKRAWQYLYRYPQIGIAYQFSNFGGSKYLGQAHSLVPFIVFPIIKHEKFQLGFKVGLGIGYLTKKFDRLENYKNLAIGSHLNASISFELKCRFKINERLFLNAGLSMSHLSNGTVKTPNYGMNIPGVFGGLTFKLNNENVDYQIPDSIPDNKWKKNFRMMFWGASKQVDENWNDQFMVYVLTADFSQFYCNVNRYLIGLDIIYDESVKYVLFREAEEVAQSKETIKVGLNLGHEFVLEQLSLYVALGVYVHNIDPSNGKIYDKIGINYAITPNLLVGVSLKAHYAQADYLSVGIGFNL